MFRSPAVSLLLLIPIVAFMWIGICAAEPHDMDNYYDERLYNLERRQEDNSTSVSDSSAQTINTSGDRTSTIAESVTGVTSGTASGASTTVSSVQNTGTTQISVSNSGISNTETTSYTQATTPGTRASTKNDLIPATFTRLTTRTTTSSSTSLITTRSGNTEVTLTSTVEVVGSVTEEVFSTAIGTSSLGQAGNNGNGQSSGMHPSTRNIVIGVVVGIGAAIILGGLIIVVWRVRKKSSVVDEHDSMREGSNPAAVRSEIESSTPEASIFQATLNQYHKPGPVNASLNF